MYQPVIFYIGLRYLRGRSSDRFARFVSWLSAIGITLGVTSLVIVLSIMNGFEQQLKTSILSTMPQVVAMQGKVGLDPVQFPSTQLLQLPGVNRVEPLVTSEVILQSTENISVGYLLGVNQQDHDPLMKFVKKAKYPILTDKSYQVIVGNRLANKLKIKPGDKIRITVPSVNQLTPLGRIPSQRLFTVAGIFISRSEADMTQVIVNQADASRLMRYKPGNITGWRLYLDEPLQLDNLLATLKEKHWEWQDWRERKGELFQAVKMERNTMGLLVSLIIVVALFNLITSLSLMVMEKQAEVAILLTQGLSRGKILLVFMIQGATAGVIGAILGAIFGVLIASNVEYLMPTISGIPIPVLIKPLQVMSIVLFAIIFSLLSTCYPSWRAAAVQPAEALRYE